MSRRWKSLEHHQVAIGDLVLCFCELTESDDEFCAALIVSDPGDGGYKILGKNRAPFWIHRHYLFPFERVFSL